MSQYDDALLRDCCLNGTRETTVSYSCERRSRYILNGEPCVDAFLHCCQEMENLKLARGKRLEREMRGDGIAVFFQFCCLRGIKCNYFYPTRDDSYMDINDLVSRTKFPESWLWSDVKLPACPPDKPNWWAH